MRLVVVDTSLLLPAFLTRSPKPHGRALLILFGLGALTLHERTIQDEIAMIEDELERTGGRSGGEPADLHLDAVRRRRAELREQLPVRAPDDLCLVGSVPLFDELERKVREVGDQFDPTLPDNAPETIRRVVERLSATIVVFDPREQMPARTIDPHDDYLVEMAFRADAFAIVARDRAIVPERKMVWSDARRGVDVLGFWQGAFIEDEVENSGFTIDEVDPRLLELVLAPLE